MDKTLLTTLVALAAMMGYADYVRADNYEAARAVYLQATTGDSSSVDKALEQFAALIKTDPTNPVYVAFHAAALGMRARDALIPWTKVSYAEEGAAEMDHALSLLRPEHHSQRMLDVPIVMQTKLVAANALLATPVFMNRRAQGAKLLKDVLNDDQFASVPIRFRISILQSALKPNASASDDDRAERQRQLDQLLSVIAAKSEPVR